MRKRRWRLNGCFTIIAIVAVIFILKKSDIFSSLKNIFLPQPVVIDESPILIKEIKSLGQLITATMYDEVVADSTVVNHFPHLPITDDRLVIIARGKVEAGVNLKLMADSNTRVIKDTVWMQLPPTQIIDVIINPENFEIFEEKGNWKPEAVSFIKLKAKTLIIDHALHKNIIAIATNKAKAVLENFLHAAGFKIVLFN